MKLKICKNEDSSITVIGVKEFNPVSYQASKWIREEIKNIKTFDYPNTTNGIFIKYDGKCWGTSIEGSMGYFHNNNNTIYKNTQSVALFSLPSSVGHGLSIIPKNFMNICALFTARKTIQNTWINHYDEYFAPNTEHPYYAQWNNDAVVYALFNSKSNQSSLRNVQYKGKTYQIKNEFFFMSKDEMKQLANGASYTELYNDVKFELSERYVYTLLQTMQLSDDAKYILESARTLVRETLPKRPDYSREHPELNLNSWDAGYVQLKGLWKEVQPEKFKLFREDYLKFEKRMRDGVYKFGFLEPDFSTDYIKEPDTTVPV
jgi:hypothetical protein